MEILSECLVCAKDSNGSGPGQHKKGDIATVKEPGYPWHSHAKICLPKFFILKTDVTVEKARLLTQIDEEMIGFDEELQEGIYEFKKRRLVRLYLNEMPQAVRDENIATGEYTATKAQIKPYHRTKTSGEEADLG